MNWQDYLLGKLREECLEVAHRVCKADTFGLSEVQPGQDRTNAQRIGDEVVDVIAILEMLSEAGVELDTQTDLKARVLAKKHKVLQFAALSRGLGRLEQDGPWERL